MFQAVDNSLVSKQFGSDIVLNLIYKVWFSDTFLVRENQTQNLGFQKFTLAILLLFCVMSEIRTLLNFRQLMCMKTEHAMSHCIIIFAGLLVCKVHPLRDRLCDG